MSIPEIFAEYLVYGYRNRTDNDINEVGMERWIQRTVNGAIKILSILFHEHNLLGDLEDDLYRMLMASNDIKDMTRNLYSFDSPTDIAAITELVIRNLGISLYWKFSKLVEANPDDYPDPEDVYDEPEDALDECFLWHYASVA